MPQISYKFTIPQDKYEAFSKDILAIASKINFEGIEFDDKAKTVLFHCDACDLMRLFKKELEAQGKNKDYPFFCCAPEQHVNCERLEDGKVIDFVASHQVEKEVYDKLEKSHLRGEGPILASEMTSQIEAGASVVIGEYHSDPQSKTKLIELLESLAHLEQKPVLVLERVSSSRDEALQSWLNDGSPDSKIPESIKTYCDFIDRQNLDWIWPSATKEERETVNMGYLNILACAKKHGFEVVFMESEHSTISTTKDSGHRHQYLVSSMKHIIDRNPGRNFIAFCGANHEERSENNQVILSDVLGAFSCEIFPEKFSDKLRETAEFHREKGNINAADTYLKYAQKYENRTPSSAFTERGGQKLQLGEQREVS